MLALMPIAKVYNTDDGVWDESDPEWEMTFWPRIVFGDCGTQSGVSVVWFHPMRLLDTSQPSTRAILATWSTYASGPENDQAREILRLCRGLGGEFGLCVGLESFTVQRIAKEATFLSSPRIASRIEFGLWSGIKDPDGVIRKRMPVYQSPTDIKKGPEGDRRLQQLGLYTPGPDHINDSMKHALLHMGKMRNGGLGTFERLYGFNPDWKDA
jgi:hypothetical protein